MMNETKTEQLITATCRRLSSKIGHDLQTVHDTLTAEIRRSLTSLAVALEDEAKKSSDRALDLEKRKSKYEE